MSDDAPVVMVERLDLSGSTLGARTWWDALRAQDRHDVMAWLADGVPDSWEGTRLDYAWTECPRGLFSGRWGRIL